MESGSIKVRCCKGFLRESYFESYQEYCIQVSTRICTRLSCSDIQHFRDIIFILLGTQGWQKILDEQVDIKDPEQIEESNGSENPLDAIDRLVEYFRLPLEGAGAKVSEIRGEFGAMIS